MICLNIFEVITAHDHNFDVSIFICRVCARTKVVCATQFTIQVQFAPLPQNNKYLTFTLCVYEITLL